MPPTQKLPAGHRSHTLGRSVPRTRKNPGVQEKKARGLRKSMWPDEANLSLHPPGHNKSRNIIPATLFALDVRLAVRHTPRGSDLEAYALSQSTELLPATQRFVPLTSLPIIIAKDVKFPVERSADADKKYSKANTSDMLDSITEFIELMNLENP